MGKNWLKITLVHVSRKPGLVWVNTYFTLYQDMPYRYLSGRISPSAFDMADISEKLT